MELDQTLSRINDRLMTRENGWAAFTVLAAIAGAAITRNLFKAGWRATTDTPAPLNPAAPDANWTQALTWGVVTGALIGVVRALSRRGVTSVRRRWD